MVCLFNTQEKIEVDLVDPLNYFLPANPIDNPEIYVEGTEKPYSTVPVWQLASLGYAYELGREAARDCFWGSGAPVRGTGAAYKSIRDKIERCLFTTQPLSPSERGMGMSPLAFFALLERIAPSIHQFRYPEDTYNRISFKYGEFWTNLENEVGKQKAWEHKTACHQLRLATLSYLTFRRKKGNKGFNQYAWKKNGTATYSPLGSGGDFFFKFRGVAPSVQLFEPPREPEGGVDEPSSQPGSLDDPCWSPDLEWFAERCSTPEPEPAPKRSKSRDSLEGSLPLPSFDLDFEPDIKCWVDKAI